ncbi:MAG: DUF748 domain-containing protein [Rhodospirillales bacterium]|nr:DUF748 domain-containing protein [Rhodospirillales bacterium]
MKTALPPSLAAAWTGLSTSWRGLTPRVRRALRTGALSLAMLLALLAFLPEAGLRWGLDKALRQLGMAEIHLASADIALFNGRLVIKSFSAGPRIGQALGLDRLDFAFRWLPLLKREVSVESLNLAGLTIDLKRDGAKLLVNGAVIDLGGGQSGGDGVWNFDIDSLTLSDSRITFADGPLGLKIELERLELRNLKSADPNSTASFHIKGRIDGASFDLTGSAVPFAASPSLEAGLTLQDLDLKLLEPLLSGMLEGRLTADLKLAGTTASLDGQGRLELREASFAQGQTEGGAGLAQATTERLHWDGTAGRLDWQGDFSLQTLRFKNAELAAQPERLAGQGRLTLDLASDRLGLRWEGKLDSGSLPIDSAGFSCRLTQAGLDGLVEAGRDANGDIRLSSHLAVAARNIVIAEPGTKNEILNAPKFDAGALRLTQARLAASGGFVAEALTIDDLLVKIARRTQPPAKEPASPGQQGPKAASASPRLALDRFAIAGNSRFDFEDRTPSQPVSISFDKVKLSLANLDSDKPGQDSPFEIEARAGNASLSLSGHAKPFASGVTARFSTNVKAFELPPLSPYAADALGVELQTGHFDGEISARLENGDLEGRVDLALSNLFAAQPDPNAPLAKQTGMPVALVLDLLRDGEDRIRLSIPVGGNLSDPQFDLSDAVSKAIGGALRQTAVTTLKVVFPVLLLIDGLADAGSPLLAPVPFTPGADELESEALARLEIVGKLLRERPGLKLSLCPASSPDLDWPVLLAGKKQEELGVFYKMQKLVSLEAKPEKTPPDLAALTQLAEKRSANVKSALAEKSGIDPGRLFLCLPKVDAVPNSQPRVDLML